MYAAPKPFNPAPVDDYHSRRKYSAPNPRRTRSRPIDPMSLEYYGHPSDEAVVSKLEPSDRPVIEQRDSHTELNSPRRGGSDELRDGIEKWQRSGATRPGAEQEEAVIEEAPVAQPRPKIVLPFFRWFGTTANTPGYRKIKVGVLQDSEVPGTDELAPALEASEGADNQTNFGFTIHDDDTSRTPGKALDDSVLSPHAARTSSPGPRFDNKASSSVTRELFEINRPRYPRKDILEHLVSQFLTHFKPSWCPWMDADELKSVLKTARCQLSWPTRYVRWQHVSRIDPSSVRWHESHLVTHSAKWPRFSSSHCCPSHRSRSSRRSYC